MASSAFSFHCMICFEEFDPLTNYPVVLPCGHTYVCIQCANRLDKCMECREPLVTKIEFPAVGTETAKEHAHSVAAPSRYGSSYRRPTQSINRSGKYFQSNAQPQPKPIIKRLPLPKNAVLLSLIQASEPARRRHEQENDLPPNVPTNPSEERELPSTTTPSSSRSNAVKFHRPSPLFVEPHNSVHFEDQQGRHMGSMLETCDEEHKIRVGTYLEGGACGTYAVAAKSGLFVYPSLFEHTLQEEDGITNDVENMVKNSYRNKCFRKEQREKKGLLPRSTSCVSSPGVPTKGTSSQSPMTKDQGTTEITLASSSLEGGAVEASFVPKSEDGDCSESNEELSLREEAMSDPGGSLPYPNLLTLTNNIKSSKPTLPPIPSDSSLINNDPALSATLKLRRQFSLGPNPTAQVDDGGMDRSLIRLKYGDRVQVVSMDSRGWVKLARGYGYIRLESDKQLVKVGGTSDKACQIEAMLHELSLERNRLKHEQKKLEHLSAGLMIDLQCSLLTSDDTVIVQAPEGLALMMPKAIDHQSSTSTKDDIDISTKSRTTELTPVRSLQSNSEETQPHEIRSAKSHSPGRNYSTSPPSPPYHQMTPGGSAMNNYAVTPTRVNFRTGMSGHRALSSSHSHPHDFINPGPSRSMSNHAGLGTNKSSSYRGRSLY